VVPENMSYKGRKVPFATDDTHAVIDFLSLPPIMPTFFNPFFSHVLSYAIDTKCIPI
jgi:hypothetical protein